MPLLVRNIGVGLDESDEAVLDRAARKLKTPVDQMRSCVPLRRSLDARAGREPQLVYDVEVTLTGGPAREKRLVQRLHRNDITLFHPESPPRMDPGNETLPHRPVVIGFGPAGMFAALVLAEYGYQPIVLERGRDVQQRHADILRDFYRHGIFNPESNLLFGEGGAGAYSDGKLYTRGNDPRRDLVLQTLVDYGANDDILVDGRPHVGSDKLPGICRRIRLRIEELGGEVRFGSRVDDFEITDGRLGSLKVGEQRLETGPVILAIGHSARDTIRRLASKGVQIVAKPFQLGVRIEHPQEMVNRWQYREFCNHPRLGAAEYHLVAKNAAGANGDVFSFCMCPGGQILPTNESAGEIATNGASRSTRNGPFANAAFVMTIRPEEIHNNPLEGLASQEHWERLAFDLTGGTYRVPAQRASDFLAGRLTDGMIETSYPFGAQSAEIRRIIPPGVADAIHNALEMFDRKMPGFAGKNAVITGPETRASVPVRIVRDEASRQSVSAANLYPVGEGAGYAGGIVSAAIDGIKSAEAIITRYAPVR